jgi:ribosome biogenesis protein Tsr3
MEVCPSDETIATDLLLFSLWEDVSMQVAKIKLETIIRDLPELVDVEDVNYRLYLLEKIEAGEADIREGRVLAHEQAVERLSGKKTRDKPPYPLQKVKNQNLRCPE